MFLFQGFSSLPVAHDGTATPPAAAAADNRSASDYLRQAPFIDSAEPMGEDAAVTGAIYVTFSQPMARSTVERTFTIRPRIDGRFAWQDDFAVRFQPLLLAHGVTYEVSVGGHSRRGMPLGGQTAWWFTTVADAPVLYQPGSGSIKVPILMYHYIRVNPDPRDRLGFNLSVTPSDFAAQMEWMMQSGYHPITMTDLYAYLSGTRGLPSRPVILTFDDGYADFYYVALPVLRSHDFRAVAYVVSGFVGRPGYMNAAQVVEADHTGIEIGSHTVDHVNLTNQTNAGLRYELSASRQSLEQLLGHPVLAFCYPSGRFNSGVVSAVEATGYQNATTTQEEAIRTFAGRYFWGRLRVSGGENLQQFAASVLRAS